MIGALLMSLCLAIVFLTRPNRKRDQFLKKLLGIIKQYFTKNHSLSDYKPVAEYQSEITVEKPDAFTVPLEQTEIKNTPVVGSISNENLELSTESDQEPNPQQSNSNKIIDNEEADLSLVSAPVENESANNQLIQDKQFHNFKVAELLRTLSQFKEKKQQSEDVLNDAPEQSQETTEQPKAVSISDSVRASQAEILKMITNSLSKITFTTSPKKMDDSIIDVDTTPHPIHYNAIKPKRTPNEWKK